MRKVFILSFLLCLIFLSVALAQGKNLVPNYQEEDVRYLEYDLDRDGQKEIIQAEIFLFSDETRKCLVTVKDGEEKGAMDIEVDHVSSCHLNVIDVYPTISAYIGVFHSSGAHSGNLDLIEYSVSENGLKRLIKAATFFSDRPSFELKDVDSDGIKEIIVENRDYGNDPISNGIRTIYKYSDGNKWEK